MADPLSIAASIITVVQVTDQVLTCCYAYVGRVKTAAADIDRAVQETSLLKGLLLNLHGLVQDEPNNERFNSLVAPAGALSICTEALKEMEMKLRPTKPKKLTAKERLLWPFESKKLEEILVRIERQKPAILLALATDNLDSTRKIQSGVEDIQTSIESAQMQDKRDKILNWLRPNDPKDKHMICRQQHEDGTNQWILNNPNFREWTQKPRRNIWLHGIPGCGKSVLSSTIIEHVEKLCQSKSGSRLAYYYFDFSDASNQKLSVLLQSLLFQLCVKMDLLPDALTVLYDECDRGRSNASEKSLAENLFAILDSKMHTYIIIDGLDECPYNPSNSERSRLNNLLVEEIGQQPGNYSFLFTSRKEHDIEEAMQAVSKRTELHTIAIQTETVDSDVRLYVQRFVSGHKRISKWTTSIREEIEAELVKGSQGMFRWAECQLQIIGNCVLPGVARKKLKQLPTTLYESYDRILESISEENIGTVRSALMFLAHSMRPMAVEEIADAVLIDVEDQLFDPEERTDDPLSVILELCSSLVTVTEAHQDEKLRLYSWTRQYGSLGVVRFAHYSVKEYIISERNKQTALKGFYFDQLSSHQHITQALLLYILTIGSSEEDSRRPPYDSKNTPLRFYASQYWPQHCRQVPPEKRPPELLEQIHALFNTEDPGLYIFWLNSYNQDYDPGNRSFHQYHRSLPQFAPPIYFASLLGELSTCEWLIENGHQNDDSNRTCALGTALQAAALGNHTKIVQLLLDEGSQVNTDCGNFGDPLQAAAFGGGLETVELLLKNGAVINTEHGEYGNALIAAAHMGHLEVAKKLLDCGADPELSSRENGKAIAGAAASGQADLVKLLLLKGNDINDPNEPTGSALYCASKTGDVQLVRMLIKAGADVNCISGKLHTALQAACNEGHVQVVKVLLANSAGVNIFGGRLDSALQACIDHGDMDVLHLLLDHGADLNHEGGLYHSPLHCATFRGKARAAEILLDRNAKFNDEIFLMAIEYGHESLVSRMFSKGVNVNAQGKEGTALQLAIQSKDNQTARALLADDSIEIDARGGKHGATALHLALNNGNEEMVLELLRKGASVNAEGSDFYKPLTAAIASGNEKVIHLVLDAGADINGHRGGWYDSALNVAARKGLKDVINLLLDLGTNVNESSGRPEDAKSTPLQYACHMLDIETVKLLIGRGADINAPPGEYGNALASAVEPEWGLDVADEDAQKLVYLLLESGADAGCPDLAQGCSGYHKQPTALDLAIKLRKNDLISVFLTHGAEFCSSSLRLAAFRGNEDVVKQIIASGADINEGGDIALCDAIDRHNSSVIQQLLDAGVDLDGQLEGEWNWGCPLGYAIEKSNLALVRQLLDLGANPNNLAGRFGSALRHAVHKGEETMSTLLIEMGADPNVSTHDFRSPLNAAVYHNSETMIRQLLDAGANVNIDDGNPFVGACRDGNTHMVNLFIDAGAELHIQQGVPGHALHEAARWGHVEVCKLLVAQGVDVNARGEKTGNALRAVLSNMHICRSDKATPMVNYLLSIGADVNAPPCQNYVSTLQAAVANGHGRFIDTLIGAGADVNAYDPNLGTALISSARYANKKWLYSILDLGANPHLTGGPYGSAIHAAARDGELDVVKRLLDAGVEINLVAGKYGHILQAACNPRGDVDYLPCVRLLIERGSDVNARGGKYETALQSAAKRGKLEAVKILLDHGADSFVRGGKFGTAMEAAKANEHWHIFNYIGRYIRLQSGEGLPLTN